MVKINAVMAAHKVVLNSLAEQKKKDYILFSDLTLDRKNELMRYINQ